MEAWRAVGGKHLRKAASSWVSLEFGLSVVGLAGAVTAFVLESGSSGCAELACQWDTVTIHSFE